MSLNPPDHVDPATLYAHALSLQGAGRSEEARQAYESLLSLRPSDAGALNNLGVIYQEAGLHTQALTCFDTLVNLQPEQARAHANRGVALKALGLLGEARNAYTRALALDPTFDAAHSNLGNLLYADQAYTEALVHLEHACRAKPMARDTRFVLAKTLLELQQHARARAELELILRDAPDDADVWGTLARFWSERHAMPEALACFEEGNRHRPDYAGLLYNRGLARLLSGDWSGGFADYERRFDVPDFPSKRLGVPQPIWRGEDIAQRTLLVHAEQGLGDTLQFLRHIPALSSSCKHVLLLIQEQITPLVELPANVTLVHDGQRLPAFDLVCPLLSLPHLLDITPIKLPVVVPYLHADGARVQHWAKRIDSTSAPGRLRVGLVWAGNPSHKNDANRSMELAQLRPLLDCPGVDFYSLQVGPRSQDIAALGLQDTLRDLAPDLHDFGETAAALLQLDVLVCVDTSIAHVAGALGVPVWLLLPWMPDWRWMLEREDSPWYPSMRLVRQSSYRDWAGVVQVLCRDVQALAQPNSPAGQTILAQADALIEQGRVVLERGQPDLAAPAFWQALRLCPTHARAASALAIAAFRSGTPATAVRWGQRACRLNPTDPENWSNCSAYYKATGDLSRTLWSLEQGLQRSPDYAGLLYNRGLARLLSGDWSGGFADYERRFDVPDFPSKRLGVPQPIWRGEDIAQRTLLVHAEQGLGDTLQFLRHIPALSSSCKHVLLLIQEQITPLVELPANVTLVHDGQRLPAFDLVCPLLSLPHLLDITPIKLPVVVPYLHADGARVQHWAKRIDSTSAPGQLRVGLVWAGNPSHKNDANRSMELAQLRPLLDCPGVDFYSLQVGPRSQDIAALGLQDTLRDLAPDLHDFGETAAALLQLDVLVCVDTSIAHVAGALGVPVWLLLPWMPDWRWMLEREDSPWYPSMRLVRQSSYRDWAGVVQVLCRDVQALAQPNSPAGQTILAQADALIEQGRAVLERGQPDLAAPAFWQALRLCPTHARAASALAIAAFRSGTPATAVRWGQRACRLNPTDPENWSNCGAYLKAAKSLDRALTHHLQALDLEPRSAQVHSNLGNTYGALGHLEEALRHARIAGKLQPASAEFQYNLGVALREAQLFPEALTAFRRAQSLGNGHLKAALHESLLELLTGDYAQGWQHYDCRWEQPDAKEKRRALPQSEWRGEVLDGKTILVHAEQGFGDTLQFIRYVPLLAARGAKVVLVVQPDLESIAARVAGVAKVVPSGQELPPFDFHCPLLSLPAGFQTSVETIPANTPYLQARPDKLTHWTRHMKRSGEDPHRRRVALVWAGRPTHGNDVNRSISLRTLEPLFSVPGIEWLSVQKGPATEQLRALPDHVHITNLSDDIQDFEDTAAILCLADALVTVDTSVAHLAGALGRPVHLLLPLVPDWRWLLQRDDSPWYPSAKLYRQADRGNWSAPLEQLVRDLSTPFARD